MSFLLLVDDCSPNFLDCNELRACPNAGAAGIAGTSGSAGSTSFAGSTGTASGAGGGGAGHFGATGGSSVSSAGQAGATENGAGGSGGDGSSTGGGSSTAGSGGGSPTASGGMGSTPPAPCGNGALDAGETCDDGNAVADDGCSATCQVEAHWQCKGGVPSACTPVCGDGFVDGAEDKAGGCDDHNQVAGDFGTQLGASLEWSVLGG